MCLNFQPVPAVPELTAQVAHAAFPRGHRYLTMRDTFGTLFEDQQFAALYPACGQPALAPWRLALVSVLQFAEGLSDRQAAEAVRSRIDWKYLLGLELTDPGFDASVLCEFRARLLAGGATDLLLETLLRHFQAQGLLRTRGKQRTDSTHVWATVRQLNRLELVGETLRLALEALCRAAPTWFLPHAQPEWRERYGRHFADQRLPASEAARAAWAVTIGADGFAVLTAVYGDAAPPELRTLPAVETLRQVWLQQFWRSGPSVQWRPATDLPPAPLLLRSPTDPEARYSCKREMEWLGYKDHVTETCDADHPRLITDVESTPAPVPDTEVLGGIHARLARRQLLPDEHYVDRGYTEAAAFVQSEQQYQIRLVGPVERDSSWQARAGRGYALAAFQIDWEGRKAQCPAGQESVRWDPSRKAGRAVIKVQFARETCAACPHRADCTRAARGGRQLTLLPEAEHRARQAAQAHQETTAFAAEYRVRAGVEGTHSQAVRRSGLRRCRYVGRAKTQWQLVLTAAALNFVRVSEWLGGVRPAKTRVSPLSGLSPTPA